MQFEFPTAEETCVNLGIAADALRLPPVAGLTPDEAATEPEVSVAAHNVAALPTAPADRNDHGGWRTPVCSWIVLSQEYGGEQHGVRLPPRHVKGLASLLGLVR